MTRARSGAQGAAIALGVAALLLWASRARASTNPRPVIEVWDPETGTMEATSEYDPYDPARGRAAPEPQLPWEPIIVPDIRSAYDTDDLMSAFLAMIRRAEVGGFDDALRYRTFFGGARFTDLSDHPVATGAMRGVRLSDAMCRGAGFGPGCVSTAAGAYQFILPTWRRLRAAGAGGAGSPRLTDFSPASQDEAARRLVRQIGADILLQQGRVTDAITKAGSQWASLPGSRAGQPQRNMDTLVGWFSDALEQIAG
jgi:lysozyme